MNLLIGHDATVMEWAISKFRVNIPHAQTCVGVLDKNGVLVGSAIFHNYNGANIEFSYYGPGSMTASIARGLIRFVFLSLPITRVTAITPRCNKRVVQSLPKFGFVFEHVVSRYYGDEKRLDGIMFRLLRGDAARIAKGLK